MNDTSTAAELLALLVQDKISTKRAAVLSYITSQLLRTLPIIQEELNPDDDDGEHTIIFDAPRPIREPITLEQSRVTQQGQG
jgi:hypothetical protein